MSVVRELAVEIDHPPAGIPVIYCDGTAGAAFRPDVDVELSHWIPNRTPRPYKADTSTEIAFRFLDDRGPPLTSAIAELREREPGPATWELATLLSPFENSTGRPFPVVATVSRGGRPAASGLSPEVVGECLAGAFCRANRRVDEPRGAAHVPAGVRYENFAWPCHVGALIRQDGQLLQHF